MIPATLAGTGGPLVTHGPHHHAVGAVPLPPGRHPGRWVLVLVLVLALAGCSSTPVPSTGGPGGGGDRFPLQIEAVTTSSRLVDEAPGDTCLWHGPTYTVRDGAGVVLDTGPITTDKADEGTAVGAQLTGGSCVLVTTVEVTPADVYHVQVSTVAPDHPGGRTLAGAGDTFTGDAIISHEDADTGQAVTVTLEGPAPTY